MMFVARHRLETPHCADAHHALTHTPTHTICLLHSQDYTNERREVLEAQGNDFVFTKGDYIAKVMLGAIDPFFDLLDETRVPEGMAPLLYPSFPPLLVGKHMHYRSQNSGGGGPPNAGGGALMGGGGSGKK